MDDELDYRGTQVSPIEPISPVSQDIADKGAITAVQELLKNRILYYDSIDSLGTDEKLVGFNVKQQLAINKKVKFHLTEFKEVFDEVIENMKGQG